MVSQTSIAICALCKNPLESRADLQASPSRLCGKCCSLIETIFPQAASGNATSCNPVQTILPVPEIAGVQRIVEPHQAVIREENLVGITDFTDNSFNQIAGPNGFHKPLFVQAEQDFAPVYDIEDSDLYFQEAPAPRPVPADVEATPQLNDPEHRPALELEFPAEQSENAEVERFKASEDATRVAQAEPHQEIPAPEQNFHAPEPLAEDLNYHSENQISNFPYLVEDEKKKRFNPKLPLGIAGVVLLAGLAAAYIFIYKPLFNAHESSATAKAGLTKVDDKAATKAPVSNSEAALQATPAKPTDSKAVAADAKKAAEAKTVEANPATDANQSESGQFALQAGVFSTEANAGKLADQLKRAGIPAYVASSKGNKFRVLVGKFASSSEAQKYIAQAQTRSNTAGIRLELFASEINP